ncbi:MAG: hypothetical protein KDA61_22140 [Planctomycetales bacterium]|nr:hypothetical protein [Planctomycetales bacterium]
MSRLIASLKSYFKELWDAWNGFWFSAIDPATVSLLRLLAGGMLLYTHLIWSLDLAGFIGPDGYLPLDALTELQAAGPDAGRPWHVWSLFFVPMSPWLLWTVHLTALVVFAMFAAGLFTRATSIVAYLLAVSYAQRVTPGAYFGLDKVNCMMAMYLMLAPCGARYSLDRWRRLRQGDDSEPAPSVAANLATRLLQLHLAVIYLFSALAKLGGETWAAGTALWWAVANHEYQSLDMTWLAGWPILTALLTHITVVWELFYICLVWNRFTRPLMLGIAVAVHAGIALTMGMITFGSAMIFANLSFLQPSTVRSWIDPITARLAIALGPSSSDK